MTAYGTPSGVPGPRESAVETQARDVAHRAADAGASWVARLAILGSGVAYVYELLERIARDWGLEDAILVIREPSTGRQSFHVRRRPPFDVWSNATVSHAPRLHTRPDLPERHVDRALVVALCRAAFRMDVLLHRSPNDPLTGLRSCRSW